MVNCQWSVVSCVNAQRLSVSLTPPLVKLLIKPGKSVLIAYKLDNLGDPTTFTTKLVSFKPKGYSGKLDLTDRLDGPMRFELENSDLALGDNFFMKTKDTKQLLLKIRAPEGAPEGDYYYSFLIFNKPLSAIAGSASSQAVGAVGSNILVTVSESGLTEIKGNVAFFDVSPRYGFTVLGKKFNFFESTDKIPVVLILENNGKNMIKPDGEITLVGNFGEKASYKIVAQNVLAGSQRILTATPSADIDTSRPTSLALSGFFLGHYKLSAALNFGEGTSNIFAATDFYAFPIRLTLAMFLTILVSIIAIRKLRKLD